MLCVYIGMVGLNCLSVGQVALVTGSSHLHLCVCDNSFLHTSVPSSTSTTGNPCPFDASLGSAGKWGVYRGAPISDTCFAEGGQSSTGSVLSWARRLLSGAGAASTAANANAGVDGKAQECMEDAGLLSYQMLDAEAADVSPGADGLLALETFQGARTPVTDPLQRGALVGLNLAHTRGHIWFVLLPIVYNCQKCVN